MGFLPSGTADKLGNRYEGRWVVRQLLHLLAERIRSVQLEAIGNAEEGVDLWIERKDGLREAHQCKAFNKSKNTWSIADLKSRDVLTKAARHLEGSGSVEFWFVSTILATELEDLSRNTQDAGDDSDLFYEHHVKGNPREKAFNAFCKAVGLEPLVAEQRSRAFDYLRRLHAHVFQDDRATRDDLEFMARHLLCGATPAVAVAALADIAEHNLHRVITASVLVPLLEPYGLRLRPRSSDPLVTSQLEELREHFIQSIEPHLAAGRIIHRPEADTVLNMLDPEAGTEAIIVHGAPGYGKSGVLYQLALALRNSGALVCAVRLDRKAPKTFNTDAYGKELGLPGSPVACLCDVAGTQPAVLILDQLDALRWTNAHAEQALDVCKALLREAQAARHLGAHIHVIIACRTFDLERDPEIRSWLSSDKSAVRVAKVEVRGLPADVVQTAVANEGIAVTSLRPKQFELLESVQRLAMWIEIVRTETTSPAFDSSTQLMRHFWCNRRRKLEQAGCDPAGRERIISKLLDHMEANACLAAPNTLLGNDQRLVTELQSSGVITVRDHIVTFGHQTNLDFLIAERAVSRMAAESLGILQWLGNRNQQSLFRREQLRQVLFLLADEQHANYLLSVASLLDGQGVRFHLRQLALETLGQIHPQSETIDFVIDRLGQERWREHVEIHVIMGNICYISRLHERGMLVPRFASVDSAESKQAVGWLWSVRRTAPALVATVCDLAIKNFPDAIALIAQIVGHDGQDIETDELFALRLECVKHGSEPHYVAWDKIVAKYPERALRLFHSMLVGWVFRGAPHNSRRDDVHIFRGRETAPLLDAVRARTRLAWQLLWPRLKWFVVERRARRREWFEQNKGSRYWPRDARLSLPRSLRRILVTAARLRFRHHPEAMLRISEESLVSRSRVLSDLFAKAFTGISRAYADQVLLWLLADKRRLHCGVGRKRSRWSPAATLIRRMSPFCSDATYKQLEQTLLTFRDPKEKRSAEAWLRNTRTGYFRNGFGMGQYHLLPALASKRRSLETVSRIGVLDRKFELYPRNYFLLGSAIRGGWVRSPIDAHDRYARMTDRAWLRLIANSQSHTARGTRRSSAGRSGFIESSVEMLSRSFGRAAIVDPERFARLGLKFPENAHPAYLAELLKAMANTKAPNEVPEAKRDDWAPAPVDSIARVLAVVRLSDEDYVAKAFCWLIQERHDLAITAPILQQLLRFVEHRDPGPDDLTKGASECSVDTLEHNALNTVRAAAALALADILWRRGDLLPLLQDSIHKLVNDEHPAVRVAAVRICLPAWNLDQSKAVDWLLQAISTDVRVAASRWARSLYNNVFPVYADRLIPIVRNMIHSSTDEVVEAGAGEAAARWVFHGLFNDEVAECVVGTVAQRKGVASAVSQLVANPDYTENCLPLIKRFLDDDVEEVRQSLARVLYDNTFFELPWAPDFLHALVRSKSGREDNSHLLWKLKDLPGPPEQFAEAVFAIVDIVTEGSRSPNAEATKRPWDVDSLIILLLRIYERASGPRQEISRQRCLDAWDNLLESRAALAWALTRGLDETQA